MTRLEVQKEWEARVAAFITSGFQWEHIDKLAGKFKRHLRSILLMVDFAAPLIHDPLIEAINFLKLTFLKVRPLGQYPSTALPTNFMPDSIKRYIYDHEQKTLLVDRF